MKHCSNGRLLTAFRNITECVNMPYYNNYRILSFGVAHPTDIKSTILGTFNSLFMIHFLSIETIKIDQLIYEQINNKCKYGYFNDSCL